MSESQYVIEVIREHPGWSALKGVEKIAQEVILYTLDACAVGWAEINVLLTDNAHMQELNSQFRGKEHPTNVLSFPGGDAVSHGGDIALGYEIVVQEAKVQGKTLKDHFKHLLVHGTLHLMGYDHEHEADARAMEVLEIRILQQLGVANPYDE